MALFQSTPTLSLHPSLLFPSSLIRNDIPTTYLFDLSTTPKRSNQTIQPSYTRFRTNDETRFEIEIPGVAQQDVSLELNDRKLVLTAKRFAVEEGQNTSTSAVAPAPAPENGGDAGSGTESDAVENKAAPEPVLKYHLVMRLGPRSNGDAISCQLSKGVLSIRIPHAEVAKPRSIEIGS